MTEPSIDDKVKSQISEIEKKANKINKDIGSSDALSFILSIGVKCISTYVLEASKHGNNTINNLLANSFLDIEELTKQGEQND